MLFYNSYLFLIQNQKITVLIVFYDGISKWSYTMSTFVQNSGFMVFSKDTRKKPWGKCKFGTGQKLKIAVIYVNIM